MKSVPKILTYQRRIISLLSRKDRNVQDVEHVLLTEIGHIACFESFTHALQDLIANGRITYTSPILHLNN